MDENISFSVCDLYARYGDRLKLEQWDAAKLDRPVMVAEAERPGLSLTGYVKNRSEGRILIFGRAEIDYLLGLEEEVQVERLAAVVLDDVPAVIVSRGLEPLSSLRARCKELGIPLLCTPSPTMRLFSMLTVILSDEFSPMVSKHGTLVEAFGVGVLITGDSAVGKSEAALGLIERRHRLISDDVVRIRRREGSYLEGSGPELTRHLLEIRGIGIINVAHLYGAVCVSEKQRIDVIVNLEAWNDQAFYDRVGLEEKRRDILGIKVPFHVVPVKPGRDVVQLIETIVLNYRLKGLGYNSAKEFNRKLLETIASGQKQYERAMP
ncbi:MAG: HPr(Ser) kinase/phosphatase [Chlamydiia bacterium]|nr:HPr(Ser) kinase/phosphatase [Chlamydiia bacterium]